MVAIFILALPHYFCQLFLESAWRILQKGILIQTLRIAKENRTLLSKQEILYSYFMPTLAMI